MTATNPTAALITGANSGIGKEAARQFAALDRFDVIYLACRNDDRAQAAKADLERATGTAGRTTFRTVRMDTSDIGSVRAAISSLDHPLDTVVMNAGGTGGSTPLAHKASGVTEIFAGNVLGHVVLLEQLIGLGALTNVAVLTGSEAARGVPKLRIKRPTFAEHSADEFARVIDGSFFAAGGDVSLAYGQAKYLGALWISALSRQHPDLRLLTMSPGNTAGTDVFNDLGTVPRTLLNRVLMPYVFPRIGLAHPVHVGTKRLVDAAIDDSFRSGVFYASAAHTVTGPVVDQAGIVADFADPAIADHANEAIHRFITTAG